MTTAEIPRQLRKAASIIEERGHAQGSFGSPDGPVCLASALAEADGSAGERNDFGDRRSYVNQPLTHAGKVLARDIYEPVSTVWPLCSYNNRHTTEEIIEQLEKTAAKLEAKEQREEVVLAS